MCIVLLQFTFKSENMKRLLTIILICSSFLSFAQEKFVESIGVGVTPQFQLITESTQEELGQTFNYPGITYNIIGDFNLSKRFKLSSRINYEDLNFVIPNEANSVSYVTKNIEVKRIETDNSVKFILNKDPNKSYFYVNLGVTVIFNLESTITKLTDDSFVLSDPYIAKITSPLGFGGTFKIYENFAIDMNLRVKPWWFYNRNKYNHLDYNDNYQYYVTTPLCLNLNLVYNL